MKIEKDVHKVEFLKRLNLYDITNIIISIIGIIVSNYEMVQLIKSNSSESYKFIIYNVIICLVIAFVNIYGFFNKRQLIIEKMNVEELEEKIKIY